MKTKIAAIATVLTIFLFGFLFLLGGDLVDLVTGSKHSGSLEDVKSGGEEAFYSIYGSDKMRRIPLKYPFHLVSTEPYKWTLQDITQPGGVMTHPYLKDFVPSEANLSKHPLAVVGIHLSIWQQYKTETPAGIFLDTHTVKWEVIKDWVPFHKKAMVYGLDKSEFMDLDSAWENYWGM